MPVPANPPGVNAVDPTTLAPAQLNLTSIISNVIRLASRMTEVLQKTAAAQATLLTLYANMQRAYTDKMADIPISPPPGTWATATDAASQDARARYQAKVANLTSTLQNRQSIVSDTAKAQQSAVNQSNDAVNQQANIGSTLLQEVQTLLSAIYR